MSAVYMLDLAVRTKALNTKGIKYAKLRAEILTKGNLVQYVVTGHGRKRITENYPQAVRWFNEIVRKYNGKPKKIKKSK